MIQSRYYLTITLLFLFTSCIRNSNERQTDNSYNNQYIELNETKSFNDNGTYEYQFKVPTFDDDNLDFINQFVLESVAKYMDIEKLKNDKSILNKDKLLTFVKYHIEQVGLDSYDTDVEHLELFKKLEIDTLYTIRELLVIVENQESYTGGAHGAYSTNYFVFDIKNKKLLKTSDIFDLNKLTEIAYDYFLTERGLSKNHVEIEKEGYWFNDNKFHLNDNFSIDSKNVTFLYNTYEITSYSEGQIIVEIPLYKLESTIKKEYKYIINKD
ncbi:MAG: hypothetical protein CVV25_00230 [Ignavibacteriae bacterium HGW-Ignavibacteriae-4]|jgi:hypothetical protein|nr:MAG: hypothetical protein CVV25_00230 [Ignavibacteriae bacterium HGW-Ignavibacteriae-4]